MESSMCKHLVSHMLVTCHSEPLHNDASIFELPKAGELVRTITLVRIINHIMTKLN